MNQQIAEDELARTVGSFDHDPLGYVMFAFPWDIDPSIQVVELSEPWASKYGCKYGPDKWACEFLDQLGEQMRGRGFDPDIPTRPVEAIQMATASGHGIGKSTTTAQLVCFILDCWPHSKGVVTANTSTQLSGKTFAEIAKWRAKSITAHWWDISPGAMYVRHKNPKFQSSWRVDGMTWRKEQSEAFAGLHAATSIPFFIFDEASAIDESIFNVAQGGLTDGAPMVILWGNPTRNSGYFFEAFHRNRHRWITRQIDSRECSLPNKLKIQQWCDDYGEDSDFVRVRVKGTFPRAGSAQLIAGDVVLAARARDAHGLPDDPTVMGVDVARFGEDESVIAIRRGPDARSFPWGYFRGLDNMQLAARVAEQADQLSLIGHRPAAIFVDGGGPGSGVIDRLRQLGYPVIEVNFGGKADADHRYRDKSAEMWDRTKAWLAGDAVLPEEDELLAEQLTQREYGYTPKMQLVLERKQDMKERGLESPDRADALVLTFAFPVHRRTPQELLAVGQCEHEYDPFA